VIRDLRIGKSEKYKIQGEGRDDGENKKYWAIDFSQG
jgi:hypothetical protein